jgi:hypothetical protein
MAKGAFMKFKIFLFILVLPVCASADPIYKSVDEKGNVTYSSEEPSHDAKVKKVNLPPAPTEAQVLQSKQQHEKIRGKSQNLSQERQQRVKKNTKKKVNEEEKPVGEPTDHDPGRALRNPKVTNPIN